MIIINKCINYSDADVYYIVRDNINLEIQNSKNKPIDEKTVVLNIYDIFKL